MEERNWLKMATTKKSHLELELELLPPAQPSCEEEDEEDEDDEESVELEEPSLSALVKNALMPFCQSGFGRTTTGLPPAYFPFP